MILIEEERDIFTVSDDYLLAHCVCADIEAGAGIAKEFSRRFREVRTLRRITRENRRENRLFGKSHKLPTVGSVARHNNGRVLNLVTKEKYWLKPTYETLTQSLEALKLLIKTEDIKKIALPQIGCGLDCLEWDKVKAIINDVFKDTDVEILVCIWK